MATELYSVSKLLQGIRGLCDRENIAQVGISAANCNAVCAESKMVCMLNAVRRVEGRMLGSCVDYVARRIMND